MTTEDNGNLTGYLKTTSSSNEDLSEYTDADESISAPTEFLAEFLSAVMMKDYPTALKYCKLMNAEEEGNNDNESEDEEVSEASSSTDSENSSTSEDSSEGQEEEEEGIDVEQNNGDKQSKGSSDGDGTTGSYSSLEDDEVDPIDQLAALAAKYQIDNMNLANGNKIYNTNLPPSMPIHNRVLSNQAVMGNVNNLPGNQQFPFGTSSDSESPTEPVSQQTVQMLRARVVPTKL